MDKYLNNLQSHKKNRLYNYSPKNDHRVESAPLSLGTICCIRLCMLKLQGPTMYIFSWQPKSTRVPKNITLQYGKVLNLSLLPFKKGIYIFQISIKCSKTNWPHVCWYVITIICNNRAEHDWLLSDWFKVYLSPLKWTVTVNIFFKSLGLKKTKSFQIKRFKSKWRSLIQAV